jgi:hypothetical protein
MVCSKRARVTAMDGGLRLTLHRLTIRWRARFDICPPRAPLFAAAFTAMIFAVLTTSGCGFIAKKRPLPVAASSEEIGNLYVSAYPVVAWSDISASLAPARNWKITDAQNNALTVTSAQTSQAASVLAGALGINVAPAPASGGTTATLPTSSSLPQVTQNALGTLGSLSVTDAYQQLVAVTALFQQAAILDGQITNQYVPRGYAAYLVTFQINIQPSRKDWSYNAIVDITLMPSPLSAAIESSTVSERNATSLPPVIVKPAIITDAIEISSNERSVQEIRQALLQLSGSVAKGGASIFGGAQNSLSESVSGYGNNSIITQGIVDDATLHVRLGAESDGNGHLVLNARTYNVSLLVLTRAGDPITRLGGMHELSAVTHAYFTPTGAQKSGKVAPGEYVATSPGRSWNALAAKVAKTISDYQYAPLDKDCYRLPSDRPVRTAAFNPKDQGDVDTNAQFLRLVTHGDYASAQRCLHFEVAPTLQLQEQFYRVISTISEIQTSTRYSRLTVPLPTDGTPHLPDPAQYALVIDSTDGNSETVTLEGGQNLSSTDLHPRAKLTDNTGAWLLPTNVAVAAASKGQVSVALSFNSPSTLHPLGAVVPTTSGIVKPSTGQLSEVEIVLGPDYGQPCGTATHQCYSNFLRAPNPATTASSSAAPKPSDVTSQSECKSTAVPGIFATATTIRATWSTAQRYSGAANISFGDLKQIASDCPPPTAAGQSTAKFQPPYVVVPSNADIQLSSLPTISTSATSSATAAGATAGGSASSGCIGISGNQLQISAPGKCIMELTFYNMQSGVPVSLTVKDSQGKALPNSTLQLSVTDVEHAGH